MKTILLVAGTLFAGTGKLSWERLVFDGESRQSWRGNDNLSKRKMAKIDKVDMTLNTQFGVDLKLFHCSDLSALTYLTEAKLLDAEQCARERQKFLMLKQH